MKDIKLKKQYDNFSDTFAEICYKQNKVSRNLFYKILGKNLKNKNLLDLACGDGMDMVHYAKLGAKVFGIDMSEELIKKAKENNPKFQNNISIADFEGTQLPKRKFDIIVSKYALQTSFNVDKVFSEAHRMLKPGGEFIILTTHPLRQFLERRGKKKDYFKTKVVNSILFDGCITAKEPTHTFLEYLSPEILKKFDLMLFDEKFDPSNEQIGGDVYPGFMVMKFKKR